jgi:hypothetical protein
MASIESRLVALEAALGSIRKVVVCYPGDVDAPNDEGVQVIRIRYVRPLPREKSHES